jgi:glycerol-3-phosphate dehydrogenase
MRVAVVGAGINGLCIGWELARAGHCVTIYERDSAVAHTSSASSKLLHGGLRYIENGEFRLVREALLERRAWFDDAPDLAKPLQLTLPVYRGARRSKWLIRLGLFIYDLLGYGSGLPGHCWLSREAVVARDATLNQEGLLGAFQFWDGQMDDRKLGLWAAMHARLAGATINEGIAVSTLDVNGTVKLANGMSRNFDQVINAAGPWAKSLLQQSGLTSRYSLDLVRGSHIVLNRSMQVAYLMEVRGERRVFFVLPWQGGTLVGTTEVRQAQPDRVQPSAGEIEYLLRAYNTYFTVPATNADIREVFAGVRPLVKSSEDANLATREYALEKSQRLVTVFGGKWTTARALARKVHKLVEAK